MTTGDCQCHTCGCTFDIPAEARRLDYVCPDCGSGKWGLIKQKAHSVRGDLDDFSGHNSGRGVYNPQMKRYMRHVNDAKEYAKKNNLDYNT